MFKDTTREYEFNSLRILFMHGSAAKMYSNRSADNKNITDGGLEREDTRYISMLTCRECLKLQLDPPVITG